MESLGGSCPLGLNLVSGVGIIILNKYIVTRDGFDYMVVLSFCHLVFTCCFCQALVSLDYVSVRGKIKLQERLVLASASMGSIVFMNLSLSHNSVAFYQLSKLAWTPVTLGLEYCFFRTKVSRRVFLALLTIILGVGIATIKNAIVADLKGIILAVVAVLFSATGQILCSHYQKQKGYDSLQLYCSVCPLVMLGTFVSIPIFHNIEDLRQSHLSMSLTMHVVLSCILALGVNITNYLVLGQTSPITYQVLGHLKTVSVLLLGFVFFNDRCNKRMTGGIILAVAGVTLYSEQKRRDRVASLPNDESVELISKSTSPFVVSEKAFEK